ncbi:MAG: glycosyltransferase family 2 protein [Candidatus Aminicenantes bacterium]
MRKSVPKVSIVILNWNQKDMTLSCLRSLQKINYPRYEIILVDNGSTDHSVPAVREEFPEINIIQNSANLGVAGGRNVGIEYVKKRNTDYLLLLDNDTVVDKDFLTEMVKAGEADRRVGILTGKIYFYSEPQKIWCAGCTLSLYRRHLSAVGYDEMDTGQHDELKEVDHVAGCCLLIKKKVIDRIGLLDQNFIEYFTEDTDWCLRAREKGYRIVYVPQAKIWHHVVKKTSVNQRYWYLQGRNLMWLMRKHARLHHWIGFGVYLMIGWIKLFYRQIKAGSFKPLITLTRGTLDAFRIKK